MTYVLILRLRFDYIDLQISKENFGSEGYKSWLWLVIHEFKTTDPPFTKPISLPRLSPPMYHSKSLILDQIHKLFSTDHKYPGQMMARIKIRDSLWLNSATFWLIPK